MLEKFFKNKKGDIQNPIEKPVTYDKVYVYHHKQAVLEDGKLYDTETAEKVFTDETSIEHISFGWTKQRTYFLTPHGKWFSAEEEEIETGGDRITDVGEFCIQNIKTIIRYTNLRMEQEEMVKFLIGKTDYELYKKYFGKVEEA